MLRQIRLIEGPHCRLRVLSIAPETPTIGSLSITAMTPWRGKPMKFLALVVVLGLLVAGSAAFVVGHPHAITACATGCD